MNEKIIKQKELRYYHEKKYHYNYIIIEVNIG
jgi:hypothetical protein